MSDEMLPKENVAELKAEKREKGIYELFVASIFVKGAFAILETLLGAILLFTNSIIGFVLNLTQNELIDDPDDFFATHIHQLLTSTHNAQLYGALYLLSHGLIKLVLVIGLLRNKLWAYPASLAVLALFMLYQVVRFVQTQSLLLLALTIFDVVVFWLIYHEYRRVMQGKSLPIIAK